MLTKYFLHYHYWEGFFPNMCDFFQSLAFYLELNDISLSSVIVKYKIGVM